MSDQNIHDSLEVFTWSASRAAALERLKAFVPHAGHDYPENRNYDLGPGDRSNVSALSPWVRYWVLHEAEIIAAVLQRHALPVAEKFVQEVFWRTYFKGWLEQRRQVWAEYVQERDWLTGQLQDNGDLGAAFEKAVTGSTGIECFDAWAQELVKTGYLHNHTRMWFASICIFTLKLPWQLGADFFYRHLLDGDPASNTCSWRWVAGLHTSGKNYAARCSNIAKYTNHRFRPEGQLAVNPVPLQGEGNPPAGALPGAPEIASGKPSLLVLHEDELSIAGLPVESWNL